MYKIKVKGKEDASLTCHMQNDKNDQMNRVNYQGCFSSAALFASFHIFHIQNPLHSAVSTVVIRVTVE